MFTSPTSPPPSRKQFVVISFPTIWTSKQREPQGLDVPRRHVDSHDHARTLRCNTSSAVAASPSTNGMGHIISIHTSLRVFLYCAHVDISPKCSMMALVIVLRPPLRSEL